MNKILTFTLTLFVSYSLFGNKFYVDPINGDINNSGSIESPWSTLEEVITNNYIISNEYSPLPFDPNLSQPTQKNTGGFVHAGDTLILLDGMHGNIFLRNYINDKPITILAEEGHNPILEKVKLQAAKNWRFENLSISTEPYGYYLNGKLFFIETHGWQGPSSNIDVINCEIYSTTSPWTLADDWLTKASNGLDMVGDSINAIGNKITNVRIGIALIGDHITAEKNTINNF